VVPERVGGHYLTRCYNSAVRRFALTIVVSLLTVSASDVSRLIIAEPCGVGLEEPGQNDGACPPTCVTCGCCAQAAEPAAAAIPTSPNIPLTDTEAVQPRTPSTDPRPILHVPRSPVA
jgi:hypothetical protein